MLTLEGLNIRLGDFHLSAGLTIERGARVAVIGPSGGGKSTLLSTIAGFITPHAGRILVGGEDITSLPPGNRPVSLLFQDGNLFPHMSAEQNVGLGLRPDLRLSAIETARVREALARVGLAGKEARKPAALSGGQQSRVALARVLLRSRPVLLLDEPFSALGPALKAEMLDLVAEIAAETNSTLMMVTHDPDDALRIAPQTVLVAEGKAEPPQDTMALLENPPPSLHRYLG